MQECECTATTYNLLTNYLLLREILIKCYSRKQLKRHLANDNVIQRILQQTLYQLFSQFYTATSLLDV